MRIEVFPDRCIGSGVCALVAGDIFDQRDDDGVVVLLAEHPTPDQEDSAHEAAVRCPAGVIELHD